MKTHLSKLFLAIACALPGLAAAESDFTSGGGALSASADLDFRVVIPKFLYLQVGTGGPFPAVVGTIDRVMFTVPIANLGDSTPIGGISNGLGTPDVTVAVRGNGGAVSLAATGTAGGLAESLGSTIPWTDISGSETTGTVGGGITNPVIDGAAQNLPVTAGFKVVNRTDAWSFSYANTTANLDAGDYDGTVTYTASVP